MAAKKPISRFSFTIADPMGDENAVTVQVVALAQGLEKTAQRDDVPELAEAGWTEQTFGAMNVHVRIIGG